MTKIQNILTNILKKPLTWFLSFGFLVTSWPFIYYPFTDGDIANWVDVAREVRVNNLFLTGMSDQGHGPLLGWTAGIISKIAPYSFYAYGFFNLMMGVLGIWLMYYFCMKIWNKEKIANLATFLFATSLSFIYLSRTPLYDWPATIMYFAFGGFYYLYIREKKLRYFMIALMAIGVGSLSRFMICMGLAGIFMIIVRLIHMKSIKDVIKFIIIDGFAIVGVVVLFNFPWLHGQIKTHGNIFLKTFAYDNTTRYIKSARPDAYFRKDFYGFPIYVLVGMLPHTFCVIASFFKKGIINRIKGDKVQQVLLAGFLPCLILFSLSGHTKLARYIAYVFPFLTMLLGYYMYQFDLEDIKYRIRCSKMTGYTAVVVAIILAFYAVKFSQEAQEGLLMTIGLIVLIFSLLFLSFYSVRYKFETLRENPMKFLWAYGALYMAFFTILTYESLHAPFLLKIREDVLQYIF
jgi:hypothetical protein